MKKENKDNMAQEISITIKTTEEMADAIGKLSHEYHQERKQQHEKSK